MIKWFLLACYIQDDPKLHYVLITFFVKNLRRIWRPSLQTSYWGFPWTYFFVIRGVSRCINIDKLFKNQNNIRIKNKIERKQPKTLCVAIHLKFLEGDLPLFYYFGGNILSISWANLKVIRYIRWTSLLRRGCYQTFISFWKVGKDLLLAKRELMLDELSA